MTASDNLVREHDAAAAAISAQLSAIHTEFYGTPVARVRTHILDDIMLSMLDIELTVIEQRMLALGRMDAVLTLRHEVQGAEQTSFTAAVERATGRRVIAFLSSTNLEPPFVSELVRLSPVGSPADPAATPVSTRGS